MSGKGMCDKLLKGVAERVVKGNVNACCTWFYYQPKLPAGSDKFRNN